MTHNKAAKECFKMSKRRLGNLKCAAKVEKEISCSQRMTTSEAEEWSDEPFD